MKEQRTYFEDSLCLLLCELRISMFSYSKFKLLTPRFSTPPMCAHMLACTQGIKHSIINLCFFIKQVISDSRHYSLLFYVFGGSIDKLSCPRFCSQCCAFLCLFCKELCLMCFCQSCQLYHILLLEDVMLCTL